MDLEGKPVTVDIQQATLDLPSENKFIIAATFSITEENQIKRFSATAIPQTCENGNYISLEILAAKSESLAVKLIMVIFEKLTALLDMRNFNIPRVTLQLSQLESQPGRLVIHAKTQITQLPSI